MNPNFLEYPFYQRSEIIEDIIIVTGASRGIGNAIARQLAAPKHLIVCVGKSGKSGLSSFCDELNHAGKPAYPILCDVGNYAQVRDLYEEVDLFGLPIVGLINNAGISLVKLITETTYQEWSQVIQTNLTSVYNMCHFGAKRMIARQQGHIINISSMWGIDGGSMEVAYSASKGGVNAFTKALAKELGPSQIRVNAVALGAIDTSMNHFLTPAEKEQLTEDIALGRFGQAKEVGQLIAQLLDSPAYLTGSVIRFDGGIL